MKLYRMAKKSVSRGKEQEPMKLFYIFYNQERWDNWVNSLRESNFEPSDGGDEMPEGYRTLYNFGLDITLEVLKIIRLYQNQRFSKEEALEKLIQVEQIVMGDAPLGQIGELVESLQLSMLVLFAGCKQFLSGEFEGDIKTLVKDGKTAVETDMEKSLGIASMIAAHVINGATCCAKYIKDDIESPNLFDEWLIEIETMSEAISSLKNFDEEPGETD